MYEISHTLKVLRADAGLDQWQAAEKLGISRATLCCWETGRRSPNKENCEKICDVFNVDMNYLLGLSAIRNAQKTGVEVIVYAKDGNECGTVLLPDTFLDPKNFYWGEINDQTNQIAVFCRQTKTLIATITKF